MLPRGFLAIQIFRQFGSIGSVQNVLCLLILQFNQACNIDHIRWYDRQRFILDVDTAIFV